MEEEAKVLEVEVDSLKMKGITWRVRLLRWRKTIRQPGLFHIFTRRKLRYPGFQDQIEIVASGEMTTKS